MKDVNNNAATWARGMEGKPKKEKSRTSEVKQSINIDLSKVELPEGNGVPYFRVKDGWVDDSAGLNLVVETMIHDEIIHQGKTILKLTGSVPNKVGVKPKESVGRPIGGLPELMGLAMQVDNSMPEDKKGVVILSCLSTDDHKKMVSGLYGESLPEKEQQSFDEAVAAAYRMNHSGDGEFLARKVGGPEILVYDENRLPIWVKVSETASIVFATTGIAGGGKDTAAMSRRRVTGRSSTTEMLTSFGWKIVEAVRALGNGIEIGLVASHGGTSKDALVAHIENLDGSSAPMSGGHQFLLSTPFRSFAKAERQDVGLEMMSTIGLTGFSKRPSAPEGGWHVTFVDDSHGSTRSMELMMIENSLIEHDGLNSSNKDRTDRRNTILSWCRDLGSGCGFTGIHSESVDGAIKQEPDFWLLSGDKIPNETLQSGMNKTGLEERMVNKIRKLIGQSLSTTSGGSNPSFRPDKIEHARRCIKASLIRIYLPENHRYNDSQIERMRISVLDAAGAAFSLNSSKYAVPKLDVAIMVLPEASIASPFISIHSLTHARDLLRTILVEISDDMDELTPHGLPSIDTSRFNVSQLARRRVDAIIGALNGQDHCRTIDGWSEFWSGTRQNMFMMDGRVPKIDRTAFND